MTSYSRAERAALCDLLVELGPDAPTLCGDWTTGDLATHLFVRERRPLAGPGILLRPLAGLTERSMAGARAKHDFAATVDTLRQGPPPWSPFRVLDAQLNLVEYFVHHEDVRRAGSGWAPRELDRAEQDALWSRLARQLRALTRAAPVGVLMTRSDTGEVARGQSGDRTVTVVGPPGELLLYAFGRQSVARIDTLGDADAVRQLGQTTLGV
ncbi:MAG: TIGR03085 family metal-binding protein [Actinomycetota bacterium]|nr:TIGR03085 family metal-binding protein [Actinomycetota bacterium]